MAAQSKETLPPWGSAIAGATGAVLANTVVYPLDMYVLSVFSAPVSRGETDMYTLQRQDKAAGSDQEEGPRLDSYSDLFYLPPREAGQWHSSGSLRRRAPPLRGHA